MTVEHWKALADEAEKAAAWDRQIGLDRSLPGQSHWDYKVRTYRDTIRALELEGLDGVVRCVCCLKPLGSKSKP